MTTKNSPPAKLKAQADLVASTLKAAERGETIYPGSNPKIAEAKVRGFFRVGVVMDDKVLVIELPWKVIQESTEQALAEWVLAHMQERRDTLN